MLAGCEIRLSTPPSDSARVKHSSPLRNAATASLPAFELEAQHRAEARLLTSCDVVPGMIGEARIEDPAHRRMALQALDHRDRVRRVNRHARVQGAQAAQAQIAIEWRAGDADDVRPPAEALSELRVLPR